jgi:hypothetical protein
MPEWNPPDVDKPVPPPKPVTPDKPDIKIPK